MRPHDLIECECCYRVMRYKNMQPLVLRGPFGPVPKPGFICQDRAACQEIAYSLYLVALYGTPA